MLVFKKSSIYFMLFGFSFTNIRVAALVSTSHLSFPARPQTPFSFASIEKPKVAQQEIDSSMCVFYALANALLATQENVGQDFLFEVERLVSLFSNICNHQRGDSENLAEVYKKISDYGVTTLNQDCQLLSVAVKKFKIISLNLANLRTEKSRYLLKKISLHKKSAIIVFVKDRDQPDGHVFCFKITNNPDSVRIKVLDSVDAQYHHERRDLTDDKKKAESSGENYKLEIIFIKNFLESLNKVQRKSYAKKFDDERFQRILKYQDEIAGLNKRLIAVTSLLRQELESTDDSD